VWAGHTVAGTVAPVPCCPRLAIASATRQEEEEEESKISRGAADSLSRATGTGLQSPGGPDPLWPGQDPYSLGSAGQGYCPPQGGRGIHRGACVAPVDQPPLEGVGRVSQGVPSDMSAPDFRTPLLLLRPQGKISEIPRRDSDIPAVL